MRFLALRCLALLLSLALISGNAHAELHLGAAPHEPCPAELGHAHGDASHHRHDEDRGACCCDCLGCVSAIQLTPDLTSFLPAFLASAVLYGEAGSLLAGMTLRPEPGPPRPGTLS
jgi:hypothetical protein